MSRFGRNLAALTLAAGGALATVLGASSPAVATGGYDIVLVQKDILSGNTIEVPVIVNISPSLAANLCGVNIDIVTALTDDDQRANCPNQGRNAKVKKH